MRPTPPYHVYLGWDPRELRAYNVAEKSLKLRAGVPTIVHRLAMSTLQAQGLYTRPTREGDGKLWDEISDAPMSTGHAIARFLVPHLAGYEGWALFADGDVLFRSDVAEIFALADSQYAVQVVQHFHAPATTEKMDGQIQTSYLRKNWSSVMLLNCAHPANRALTVGLVNAIPGRDLHRFCWLTDDLIGQLPARWNLLVGHSAYDEQAALVHFTSGTPDMAGYERQPYADEWRAIARLCKYTIAEPVDEAVA